MNVQMLDLIGTAVFAISGALAAARRRFDLLGLVVVAVVTAIGGGTLRDLLLGATPVFWITQPVYLMVAAAAGLAVCLPAWSPVKMRRVLVVLDACGLAVFTAIGTSGALRAGAPPLTAAVLGVMTGVAGGLMRDLLCGQTPLVLQREIYATASFIGALVHIALDRTVHAPWPAMVVGASVVLLIRLVAIWKDLSLPRPRLRFARRARRVQGVSRRTV